MKKPKTIMIIDDDQGIVEVTSLVLQEKGYNVIALSQQEHIVQAIQQQKPDLIILDLWISHQDGRQILKELRQYKTLQATPVILMSANNELPRIARQAHATAYVSKPFDITELLDTVKKLLT